MRGQVLAFASAMMVAALATPAAAQTYEQRAYHEQHVQQQQYCSQRRNSNTAAGAVIGGIAGAVLGSQAASRGHRTDGSVLGMSCYLDIRSDHRALEIGMTWYIEAVRGTRVNPECKLLLLGHAFEDLGAVRVTLKTDLRNEHSQAAIAKLGAVKEGVLRKHGIQPNGYVRDTVFYSVLDEEWPKVREGLLARLGR